MARLQILAVTSLAILAWAQVARSETTETIDLRGLPPVATVDPLFQSFNVEMVEVTGGRFWAPYASTTGDRYAFRPPIDLTHPRLRAAAKALAPAYMRVSGTWANSTYVPTFDEVESDTPPPGFKQVLKRAQWRELVDFSKRLGLPILTSFPVSAGARDADGAWQPQQAQRLLDLTHAYGGEIAAAEFANEPNLAKLGALPDGYTAADYARDYSRFLAFMKRHAPRVVILGPGTSGEGGDIPAEDIMAATKGEYQAVSYHFYGALSQRCATDDVRADEALSEEWLARTTAAHDVYARFRDRYAPGRAIWLTETAQAACGGSPWAATWRDTFRYLDQQGRLAARGVRVVAHNTLAASDYALIDGDTMEPRPSFWGAVLWRRLMGSTVLAQPASRSPDVKLYAHCLRGKRGGVGLLAINLGRATRTVSISSRNEFYLMTAADLDSRQVRINGTVPTIGKKGQFPVLRARTAAGRISLPGQAILFVAAKSARNPSCR
jgi:heparanase 1